MHNRHLDHPNLIGNIQARRLRGPVSIKRTIPTEIYTRFNLHRKLMGHLSSVYCVCFDQTGQYIFTGADDHLIKVWSAQDGRLLSTLRGHDGEITDMSVDYENRLLASGGMDKVIRIWDLKTSKCLDCLCAHSAMVTSVKFAPYNRHGKQRYIVSTSNDGSVTMWSYSVNNFVFKRHKKFHERNRPGGRILGSSFSTGGSFLACVSSDHFIHVYGFHPMHGPYKLAELEQHKDEVDSVQFSNQGFRFVTGSSDGSAIIWAYRKREWTYKKLDMRKTSLVKAPTSDSENQETNPDIITTPRRPPKVLIVQWSRDDRYVITSSEDHRIKIWDSTSGDLVHDLKGHDGEIYLLESHPIDPRILISASHDGTMKIWDIERAEILKTFQNPADAHLAPDATQHSHASIYDIKFSPDGTMIAATDSHGFLSIYGVGSNESYKGLPEQMFFHTDYRALIRDMRNFVLDEQTHIAPHLMPRPSLVDMNGNPHPQHFQRFVPNYDNVERIVVPPLSETQIEAIARTIAEYSHQEDEEFLQEEDYECKKVHESKRPHRARPRVRPSPPPPPPVDDEETEEEEDVDDDATEIDDNATIICSNDETSDDETVIDSECTEIIDEATLNEITEAITTRRTSNTNSDTNPSANTNATTNPTTTNPTTTNPTLNPALSPHIDQLHLSLRNGQQQLMTYNFERPVRSTRSRRPVYYHDYSEDYSRVTRIAGVRTSARLQEQNRKRLRT